MYYAVHDIYFTYVLQLSYNIFLAIKTAYVSPTTYCFIFFIQNKRRCLMFI